VTEEKPLQDSPTSRGTPGIEGLRVLYADDHPEMRKAVGRLLRVAGASVTIAQDGLEATDKALAESFDLILMDLRMPRMDGFEAARALRAAECRVALIAVTADATPRVFANAIAAGFDAALPKPFALSDLNAAIHLVRERRSAQRRNSGSP
jgi:two-component system, sensor histidine kinase